VVCAVVVAEAAAAALSIVVVVVVVGAKSRTDPRAKMSEMQDDNRYDASVVSAISSLLYSICCATKKVNVLH